MYQFCSKLIAITMILSLPIQSFSSILDLSHKDLSQKLSKDLAFKELVDKSLSLHKRLMKKIENMEVGEAKAYLSSIEYGEDSDINYLAEQLGFNNKTEFEDLTSQIYALRNILISKYPSLEQQDNIESIFEEAIVNSNFYTSLTDKLYNPFNHFRGDQTCRETCNISYCGCTTAVLSGLTGALIACQACGPFYAFCAAGALIVAGGATIACGTVFNACLNGCPPF